MARDVIDNFDGEYAFLSNFYHAPFVWRGDPWPTVEHAYQASKAVDANDKRRIWTAHSPGIAKRLGNSITLRKDWESVKYGIMEELVLAKFQQNDDLAELLVATGDAKLIEGNTWNDTIWGVCRGKGKNWLGLILMSTRDKLRANQRRRRE